jgi:hypothetical protein
MISKRVPILVLAVVCFLALASTSSTAQRNNLTAAQFLAAHEAELQTSPPSRQLYLLSYMAPAALAANDIQKARAYSQELMALGASQQNFPGFGPGLYSNATHIGNIVLGQIDLTNGDVNSVKSHLLSAAQIPGSPALSSFGPDMRLAKELLESGQRDVVLQYLDLCAKFWTNDRGRLQQWRDLVAHGGTPNFATNLGYIFDGWQFAK